MAGMSWFLKLVHQGNLEKVRRVLAIATQEHKNKLLKATTKGGFNAGHVAVDRKNEKMIDLLLQYMSRSHVANAQNSDGKSFFAKAVQGNPDWYAKFIRFDFRESLYSMLVLQVDDIDNHKKYSQLWNEFKTISVGCAFTLIDKILYTNRKSLAMHMLEAYQSTLSAAQLKALLRRSVRVGNHEFFVQVLNTLPKGESVLPCFLDGSSRSTQAFLDLFFDSGRELTLREFPLLALPAISAQRVKQVLARGQFFEQCMHCCPGCAPSMSHEKFALFVDAGFFMAHEKSFATVFNKKEEKGEDSSFSNADVPLLAALALIKIRRHVLLTQKKNLVYLFEQGRFPHLPDVVVSQIQHPLSKEQMKLYQSHLPSVVVDAQENSNVCIGI